MASILKIFGFFLIAVVTCANGADVVPFSQNYYALWGINHFTLLNQGTEVQLLMDKSSGSGFRSKLEYGSGLFHMRVKIPNKRTAGIVTSFYLTSAPDNNQDPGNHDELDFEFVGTNGTLQTNVFANDMGHREQQFQLWFDPSLDFHTYEILWNQHQIVFFVDNVPIRVFKNNVKIGVNYPSKPMHIEASIWDAPWAGNVDWSQVPLIAYYQDFNIDGCSTQNFISPQCLNSPYSWNQQWDLTVAQWKQLEDARKAYLRSDYCWDKAKNHPECTINQ